MRRSLQFGLAIAFVGATFPSSGSAEEVAPPASVRFADDTAEVASFQRHVLPLFGRLGCNGRSCHGSFQGQGGFRLSLFGYDFAADHEALVGGDDPRVDVTSPNESLVIRKPSLAEAHEGGRRFEANGWEHRLLRSWIAGGAKGRPDDAAELVRLDVEPTEIVFTDEDGNRALRIVAVWSDGSREDVTPLSRFQTNDESIAIVDDEGRVNSVGRGDTHVVAFYDNGIVSVPVLQPISDRTGDDYPDVPTPTEIDRLVVAKLRKLGVVPSAIMGDAEFLRRASLDITGTLPTPNEVESFLADERPDKRSRKVDELLERPGYAAWMATRLCDWTGNTEENLPVGGEQGLRREKSSLWYDWLHDRVRRNVPYDEIVSGLVLAVGRRPGQTDAEFFAERSAYFRDENPPSFADQETMPYFWTRGRFSPPQTLRIAHAFLGVRLECAECHKHPYDQWTKADFEDFRAFFSEVRFRQSGGRGESGELKEKLGLTADQDSGGYKRLFAKLAKEGTTVPWGEVVAPDWTKGRRKPRKGRDNPSGRVITPRVLGGEAVIAEEYADPREPVMDWLRHPENPYFARAIVNRIWAGYFGIGLVDPVDDLNLANPASNEPLLASLATEFVAHGYDLKWLHRTIANSDTYQRDWRPTETNLADDCNFARSRVRRLPAEIAVDAFVFATATSEEQRRMRDDPAAVRTRKIGFPDRDRRTPGNHALALFGQPDRQSVCDCERSNEPSLLQTIYVRNDEETLDLLKRKGGWLAEVRSRGDDWVDEHRDRLVREAWLRTLSRPPRDDELDVGRDALDRAKSPADGLHELLWALLNSKEFVLNH